MYWGWPGTYHPRIYCHACTCLSHTIYHHYIVKQKSWQIKILFLLNYVEICVDRGSVRLVGSASMTKGWLELCADGHWGTDGLIPMLQWWFADNYICRVS